MAATSLLTLASAAASSLGCASCSFEARLLPECKTPRHVDLAYGLNLNQP